MKEELKIRCVMSKDSLPITGGEQALYALVDIKTGGGASFGSMPANLGLVLDRSGSMDGEKDGQPERGSRLRGRSSERQGPRLGDDLRRPGGVADPRTSLQRTGKISRASLPG